MEDKNQGKQPLPPLLAPPTKQERKRKSAGEKAETEKKLDQARGQTWVNWWSQLRESAGLRDDALTVEFLFDR